MFEEQPPTSTFSTLSSSNHDNNNNRNKNNIIHDESIIMSPSPPPLLTLTPSPPTPPPKTIMMITIKQEQQQQQKEHQEQNEMLSPSRLFSLPPTSVSTSSASSPKNRPSHTLTANITINTTRPNNTNDGDYDNYDCNNNNTNMSKYSNNNERRTAVILFSLTTVLLFADQNLMSPNLSAIASEFGLSDEERDRQLGGDVSLAFFLLGAPASILVGCLADNATNNRSRLFAMTVSIGEMACLATYFCQTYIQLYICRAITGFSVGGAIPLIYSILGDLYVPQDRHVVSALVSFGTGAGISLGQAVAGFLGPTFGWRIPFLIIAIPALMCAIAVWIFVKDPERGAAERKQNQYQEEEEQQQQHFQDQQQYQHHHSQKYYKDEPSFQAAAGEDGVALVPTTSKSKLRTATTTTTTTVTTTNRKNNKNIIKGDGDESCSDKNNSKSYRKRYKRQSSSSSWLSFSSTETQDSSDEVILSANQYDSYKTNGPSSFSKNHLDTKNQALGASSTSSLNKKRNNKEQSTASTTNANTTTTQLHRRHPQEYQQVDSDEENYSYEDHDALHSPSLLLPSSPSLRSSLVVSPVNDYYNFYYDSWLQHHGGGSPAEAVSAAAKAVVSSLGIHLHNTRNLLSTPTLVLALLQGAPGCIPWGILNAFLNDFLAQDKGFSVELATTTLMCFSLGHVVGLTLGGMGGSYLYQLDNRYPAVLAGSMAIFGCFPFWWLLNGIHGGGGGGDNENEYEYENDNHDMTRMAVAAAATPFWKVAGIAMLAGFGSGPTGPIIKATITNVTCPTSRGQAFALFNLFDDFGKGLGPYFVSLLIVQFGGRLPAFNVGVFGWVICGIANLAIYFTVQKDEAMASLYNNNDNNNAAVAGEQYHHPQQQHQPSYHYT